MSALLLLEAAAFALATDEVRVPSALSTTSSSSALYDSLDSEAEASSPHSSVDHDARASASPTSFFSDAPSASSRTTASSTNSKRNSAAAAADKPYARPGRRDARSHNNVERRRRAELAAGYERLKACLPFPTDARPSNAAILDAAVLEAGALTTHTAELAAAIALERARMTRLRAWLAAASSSSSSPAAPALGRATSMSQATKPGTPVGTRRGGRPRAGSTDEMLVPTWQTAAPRSTAPEDGFQTAPASPEAHSLGDDHDLAYGLLLLAEMGQFGGVKNEESAVAATPFGALFAAIA